MDSSHTIDRPIRDRYRISSFLGNGTFAQVYKAEDVITQSIVAIKFDVNNQGVIKHEATILQYLNQNHCGGIPKMLWYGLCCNQTIPCLVLPCYSMNLHDFVVRNHTCISDQECEIIIDTILNTLNAIHKRDIIHRDIKPENFMLCERSNRWVLIDFGLSTVDIKLHIDIPATQPSVTPQTTTSITGNSYYISPWVHCGHRPTKTDDMISAGYVFLHILFYKSLSQGLPWYGDSIEDIYDKKQLENIKVLTDSLGYLGEKVYGFLERRYTERQQ